MSSQIAVDTTVHGGIERVFDNASGYYRNLRWEKNRLTQFEHLLTRQVLEEEIGERKFEHALELGCGPGTWTELLAGSARSVTAVDLSEGMLSQARQAVRSPNVEFVHSDAALFEPRRPVDLALSVRVLEYNPEWRAMIARVGELVEPGGRLVIVTKTKLSVWRGTGRERWFGPRTLMRTLTGRRLDDNFWQRHIPARAMRDAFVAAGFRDVRVRPVIFGLPIFMRGTKQYPIIPPFMEAPLLRAAYALWSWSSRQSNWIQMASLFFSESYAVSGTRE